MTNKMIFFMATIGILLAVLSSKEAKAGPDPFIGEIVWVGYTFCPRGWAAADGQLLSINQYQSLYSLLGSQFGGDGRTTFALPDLRGRVAIHAGQSPGMSKYQVGNKAGQETVTLTTSQMPTHNHTINASAGATDKDPTGNIPGTGKQKNYDTPRAASTTLADKAVGSTGVSEAHENRPPFLTLRACIALQGIYPSRN